MYDSMCAYCILCINSVIAQRTGFIFEWNENKQTTTKTTTRENKNGMIENWIRRIAFLILLLLLLQLLFERALTHTHPVCCRQPKDVNSACQHNWIYVLVAVIVVPDVDGEIFSWNEFLFISWVHKKKIEHFT